MLANPLGTGEEREERKEEGREKGEREGRKEKEKGEGRQRGDKGKEQNRIAWSGRTAGHTHRVCSSKLSLQRDICSITPMHCG